MPAEIVLVRHAETEANAAGIWQGGQDAPLTPTGGAQLRHLRRRLGEEPFDLVVSSPLGRARASAAASGSAPELDAAWREMELGAWEGRTNAEIAQHFGDELAALRRGEDVPLGGDERMSEFTARVVGAFGALTARLSDGERALVITHGGVIYALASHVLGVDLRSRALRISNTSLSSIQMTEYGPQLSVYNDATHLPDQPLRVDGPATHLYLVRHGQTRANLEHRWQGHTDGELTDEGRRQAKAVAGALPATDALYTSPLSRAHDTARAVAEDHGMEPVIHDDLKEIGFGEWESFTFEEIMVRDAADLERLRNGEDIARGRTGETFLGVRARMNATLEGIAATHAEGTVAVVSHGGALRAFVTGLLDMHFRDRFRLGLLANTGVARVVRSDGGFALGAWNLTPHLRR